MNDSTLRPADIRKVLPRHDWFPLVPFGPAGFAIEHKYEPMRIIVTEGPFEVGGMDFRHASISRADRMPSYEEMVMLHKACFTGWAYQVFAPTEEHINIHEHALHLWGLPDGSPMLPNFGQHGTI